MNCNIKFAIAIGTSLVAIIANLVYSQRAKNETNQTNIVNADVEAGEGKSTVVYTSTPYVVKSTSSTKEPDKIINCPTEIIRTPTED